MTWKLKLTSKELEKFENDIMLDNWNWRTISQYKSLSEDFIRKYQDKVNWEDISYHQKLSEDFIIEFKDKVCWKNICKSQDLSDEFIKEYRFNLTDLLIMSHQKLSENILRYFNDSKIARGGIHIWYEASIWQKLPEDILRERKSEISWTHISLHQNLSEQFIRDFSNVIDWEMLSRNDKTKLSEQFLIEFKDRLNYKDIFHTQNLSESFIRNNINDIGWGALLSQPGADQESIIREFANIIPDIEGNCVCEWHNICKNIKLSEGFIRDFKDKVCWYYISDYQKLTEEFITEFQDKVNWECISSSQILTEEFIERFHDKVNWAYISCHQKLSEEFIRNIKNKIPIDKADLFWNNIASYQKLSPEFIKEFSLQIPEDSWMYKDKEWKRKYIQENTTYEIVNDKVTAYKACRNDLYSFFNFQYLYEIGNTYETHSDYNPKYSESFGFNCWSRQQSICFGYNSAGRELLNKQIKLIKLEIDIDDITCITPELFNHSKIRARKIKVIEEVK